MRQKRKSSYRECYNPYWKPERIVETEENSGEEKSRERRQKPGPRSSKTNKRPISSSEKVEEQLGSTSSGSSQAQTSTTPSASFNPDVASTCISKQAISVEGTEGIRKQLNFEDCLSPVNALEPSLQE